MDVGWLEKAREAWLLFSDGDDAWAVPAAQRGTFLGFQVASMVSFGGLMLLDQHIHDSLDSCISCLILNNNKHISVFFTV